uniref:Putative DNA polymerase n=1 Tax=viral metagenome TaxID=1070528 RepID=A0A6M3MD23_9ZZZZ
MQIKVARLRETLEMVKPVVPRKPTLPVLKNVLIQNGQMFATDLESMVVLNLPTSDGACLLPFSDVMKLIQYIPGNDDLSIERKRGKLTMSWSDGSVTYDAEDPKTFPQVPELKPELQGTLEGDSLMEALSAAVTYCATEESRPVLTGVAVNLGDVIEIFAGDGFRMAYQALPQPFSGESKIIIPGKSVSLLAFLWNKLPREVDAAPGTLIDLITAKQKLDLMLSEGKAVIQIGRTKVLINLIQGSPPDWWAIIGKDPAPIKIEMLASEMERAVRRVQPVASNGNGAIRLVWDENTMNVSAKTESQEIKVAVGMLSAEGGPGKVAINGTYLTQYLQLKQGVITIGVKPDSAPVAFKHRSSPLVLIMPMKVEW